MLLGCIHFIQKDQSTHILYAYQSEILCILYVCVDYLLSPR